ncbi:MAG: hypothetical protein ABIL69_11620 [candidate division WOR-3 bacterium]
MKNVIDKVVIPYLAKNTKNSSQFVEALANFSEKIVANQHKKLETLENAVMDGKLVDMTQKIIENNPDLVRELNSII